MIDVHRRPGDGNEKFLAWLFRNPFEARYAADRQQDHVGSADAKAARHKDMAEFVQQHAQEQENNEGEAVPGRLRAALDVVHAENPGEQQKESDMDTDRRPATDPIFSDQDIAASWQALGCSHVPI